MKPIISSDYRNDDMRHYAYVRNTRLPLGYFAPRFRASSVALWAACALIVLCLAGAAV